jgi:hypothetical protein
VGLETECIVWDEKVEGAESSSGVTRRSHDIVRIADASLRELVLRDAMRFVAISRIASSACVSTDLISGESGYRP